MENLAQNVIDSKTEMSSKINLQHHERLLNMLGSMQPLAHQVPVLLETMKMFLEDVFPSYVLPIILFS